MVLAFALLGEAELHQSAMTALDEADELWAPDSVRAELVNVLWLWVRHRGVDPDAAKRALRDAEALVTGFAPIGGLWEQALDLAIAHDHSPYDTLFVALAMDRDDRLLTADRAVIECFPDVALALSET